MNVEKISTKLSFEMFYTKEGIPFCTKDEHRVLKLTPVK